jgi:hypothetical protein
LLSGKVKNLFLQVLHPQLPRKKLKLFLIANTTPIIPKAENRGKWLSKKGNILEFSR